MVSKDSRPARALAAAVTLWLLRSAQGELPPLGDTLSSLPPLPDPGPCSAPAAAAAAGPTSYRRFHVEDDLIGRPLNCSREEKTCFRYNMLVHIASGRCQPVGGGEPLGCDLRVNMEAFKNGSGRLIGECIKFRDPCPGYRMAGDRRCYRKEVVRDDICGCDARPVRHVTGGAVCRDAAPTPVRVQQPEEEDRCLFPDLRFPDVARSAFFANPHVKIQGFKPYATGLRFSRDKPRLACAGAQETCFADGLVAVAGHAGCHRLLRRGPCPADSLVALDAAAALRGRAEGACVHVRGGCEPLTRHMVFGGGCLADRDLELAAPGEVSMNQFGEHIVTPFGMQMDFEPRLLGKGMCEVHLLVVSSPPKDEFFPSPPCRGGDTSMCHMYAVEAQAPLPD